MRECVEIVWLEDDLLEAEHLSRVDIVEELVANKGYSTNITQIASLSEAEKILSDAEKRVDFFISDFNLGSNDAGEDETGLDYLIKIRKMKNYKQFFILYSKKSHEQIKKGLIEKLSNTEIDLFCNFTFFSIDNEYIIENEFRKAIDISLNRWDELNAIRGLYMCAHAEFEFFLREKLKYSYSKDSRKDLRSKAVVDSEKLIYKDSYKELFNYLKNHKTTAQNKRKYKDLFDEWENLIDNRNLLAHTSEEYDLEKSCFSIKSRDGNLTLYENNLDDVRSDLKNIKEKIFLLIENPNQPNI